MNCYPLVALLLASSLALAAEPLSLAGAEVLATHESFDGNSPVAHLIDGDEETVWAGDQHDLTLLPTNLFLRLPQPTAVGAIEVVTIRSKGAVRCSALEVYARAGDGWAKLGEVRGNSEERFRVALRPAEVELLRLRVLDTEREDHAWPRIHEVRLFAPEGEAQPLQAAPLADQTRSEQIAVETKLGLMAPLPTTTYDAGKGYLGYAREVMDTLLAKGTDRYGAEHSPMLVSILDLTTQEHPGCELPTIAGQRQGDRAGMGSNLMHDIPLLLAADGLSELTGEARYRQAMDAYLSHFLEHCTATPTGLWPWGEHAHWNVFEERQGHTIHEHLGLPPQSFWDRAYALRPAAVLGEADGCHEHIVDLDTYLYNRHADIGEPLPVPRPEGLAALDFPRHGGFYHYVWAYAYSKTGEEKYLEWCDKLMDHHEAVSNDASNLMRTASNNPDLFLLNTQLSLAVTMLESVPLLGDTPTAERCDRLARGWIDTMAALPHKLDQGEILIGCAVTGPEDEAKRRYQTPTFIRHYGGGGFMGDSGKLWAQAYRLTNNPRCLDVARAIAAFYADVAYVAEAEEEENTRAGVYGMVISLLVDLHHLDGDPKWLAAAERFAQDAVGKLYYNGLFRGATNLWYYESELFPGTFIHSLVELEAAKQGKAVAPLTFHR